MASDKARVLAILAMSISDESMAKHIDEAFDAIRKEERAKHEARIKELEAECATPVLVATNRLADALADERARADKLAEAGKMFACIVNRVSAFHRHRVNIPTKALDKLANAQLDFEAALAEYRKGRA